MGKLCLCTSLEEIYLENCANISESKKIITKFVHVQAVLKQGYITISRKVVWVVMCNLYEALLSGRYCLSSRLKALLLRGSIKCH